MVTQGEVKIEKAPVTAEQAQKTIEQAQPTTEEAGADLSRAAGKLVLASIGAVALAGDSLKVLLDRMVERGEEVQEDARKRASELKEKGQRLTGRETQKVETVLGTMNLPTKADIESLPTKSDIQSLHDQLAALSTKVDQLSREKEKPSKQAQS